MPSLAYSPRSRSPFQDGLLYVVSGMYYSLNKTKNEYIRLVRVSLISERVTINLLVQR